MPLSDVEWVNLHSIEPAELFDFALHFFQGIGSINPSSTEHLNSIDLLL